MVAHIDSNGEKLTGKQYMKELRKLQAELCKLQDWVRYKGLRVIIVFEGRDAAGKGGTIKAITERVNPRVFRLAACLRLPIARNRKCTSSVICSIFRPREKS